MTTALAIQMKQETGIFSSAIVEAIVFRKKIYPCVAENNLT